MSTSTDQDLPEALAALHKDVDAFAAYVRANKAKYPERWPDKMPEAEWFEQFMAFVTLGLDEED